MEVLPFLLFGGVLFLGSKMNEDYRTGQYQDMEGIDNGNHGQLLNSLNNTNFGASYGGGIQNSSPEQIQRGTGIPLQRKREVVGWQPKSNYATPQTATTTFQVIAPDVSRDVYKQASYNLIDRSAELITNVKNNESPLPIQQVGRGLGVAANVPSAGGFHQDYRILTTNINEQNLVQLPGRTAPGAPIVPSGSLAPGISGYSDGGAFTQGPNSTKLPRQNVDTIAPAPGGGNYYPTAPDGWQSRTQRPTLKDQVLNPSTGGIRQSQIPSLRPVGVSGYASVDNVKYTNRGQEVPGTMPSLNILGSNSIGQATNIVDDRNSIPQGNVDGSKYHQYADIGQAQFNPFKGQENPIQPNNTTALMSRKNPYVIPSFSRP